MKFDLLIILGIVIWKLLLPLALEISSYYNKRKDKADRTSS